MYEEIIQQEYERACRLPLTIIPYNGSEIVLFRADLLEGGVKTAIGRCLVANAIDSGVITKTTKGVVVQGAGNTVTAVAQAVKEFGLGASVIAVVYNETSVGVRERLQANGIQVVAKSPRKEGREGRMSAAQRLCQQQGYVFLEQHEQPLIIDIQSRTFGRCIVENILGPATHFVAGVGTGGTLFGIGSALRAYKPRIRVVVIEGVGSTLTLWHRYFQVKKCVFEVQSQALRATLELYRSAGMITRLQEHPQNDPSEWFDITIDFPESTNSVVGIEGLGVGDPSELILQHLKDVSECRIVTDDQARRGVALLSEHGITAVDSAGANFFTSLQIAQDLRKKGRIVTVVTARQ